jgi:hypothetical protein
LFILISNYNVANVWKLMIKKATATRLLKVLVF